MKYDARTDASPEKREAFVSWLTDETASTLRRAGGDEESLKTFVFLAVNRSHEAGLSSQETARIIGASVARSAIGPEEEERVYHWLEALDPIATAVHAAQPASNPWWKIW